MKVLIIEDELPAADQLKMMLKKFASTIDILSVCKSIHESVKWIKNNPMPDLIFMDIELDDGKSFEIFQHVDITAQVIFTTAYDAFAIKAIKLNALDYLLKPVNYEELKTALNKAVKHWQLANRNNYAFLELKNLVKGMIPKNGPKKLGVNTMDGTVFILIEDIIRLEAASSYTNIFTKDKEKVMASRTLKEFEELLSDSGFYRVHHSHLVSLSHITQYLKGDGGVIVLSNGESIEVSRQRKKGLLELLNY
jgi:two-component system LytT family response regulator